MIKSKVTERMTSKAYKGETGDDLWQPVVEAYVKAAQKTLKEYEALGDEGAEHASQVRWEIEQLECYLPQLADEAQTEIWVREILEGVDVSGKGVLGRVMGAVMKAHKGEVDPAIVKKIVTRIVS
jgi:uncharacterized protein YqeY